MHSRFFVDHMSGFPRRPPIFNSISDVLGPKDPRNGFDILSFWFPTKSSAPDSNKWFKAQTERPTRRCVLQTDRNRSCCPGLCERPSRHWTSHLDSEVRAVKKHPPPKKGWFHSSPAKKIKKEKVVSSWSAFDYQKGPPFWSPRKAHHFAKQTPDECRVELRLAQEWRRPADSSRAESRSNSRCWVFLRVPAFLEVSKREIKCKPTFWGVPAKASRKHFSTKKGLSEDQSECAFPQI